MTRTVHDRNFVRSYARIVYWRGVWMNLTAVLVGVLASVPLVAGLLSLRLAERLEPGLLDIGLAFDNMSLLGFDFAGWLRWAVFSDWLLFLIPVALVGAALIRAQFAYFRFKAEALVLIALAEVADNTAAADHPAPATGRSRWQGPIAWGVPVAAVAVWAAVVLTQIASPGGLSLRAVHMVAGADVLLEFDHRLSGFESVDVYLAPAGVGWDQDPTDHVVYLSDYETLGCGSRWVLATLTWSPDRATRDGAVIGGAAAALIGAQPQPWFLLDVGFDADVSEISDQAGTLLDQVARAMASRPGSTLVVEGHSASEGTREYNLALSQRRAHAARDYLIALGIAPAQIGIEAYGAERPLVPGDTAEIRARNERVRLRVMSPDAPEGGLAVPEFVTQATGADASAPGLGDPVVEAPVVVPEGDLPPEMISAAHVLWVLPTGKRGEASMAVDLTATSRFSGLDLEGLEAATGGRICDLSW